MRIQQEIALADLLTDPRYAEALAGRQYAEIAEEINAPRQIPNPDTTPTTRPAPLSLPAIMAIVPPAEMAKAYQLPGFVADVKTAIDRQDRQYLTGLLSIAQAAGTISQETAGTLAGLLSATETIAPPAMLEIFGLAEEKIGQAVTAEDVQTIHYRYLGG